MVKDAIIKLLKELNVKYPFKDESDTRKFFKDIYKKNNFPKNNSFYLARKNPPTDDEFFEYFRALVFAHPFETSRHLKSGLTQINEVQYSPWVIANKVTAKFIGNSSDYVGVRIYSNFHESTFDLRLSYQLIKDYINSRYELLVEATKWAENVINEYKLKWAMRKVNRNQNHVDILKDIASILEERYCSHCEVNEAILYLNCKLTNSNNNYAVKAYRDNLKSRIHNLCNAVDSMEEDNTEFNIFYEALSGRPKQIYNMCNYHLQKIFSYLNKENEKDKCLIPDSNFNFGLQCASNFANEFAKDYVVIDIEKMKIIEIHLLVETACYLEKINQENGKIHHTCITERNNNLPKCDDINVKTNIIINFVDASGEPIND